MQTLWQTQNIFLDFWKMRLDGQVWVLYDTSSNEFGELRQKFAKKNDISKDIEMIIWNR